MTITKIRKQKREPDELTPYQKLGWMRHFSMPSTTKVLSSVISTNFFLIYFKLLDIHINLFRILS